MKLETFRKQFRAEPESPKYERRPLRQCTTCNLTGRPGVVAKVVVSAADGMQWFECLSHRNGDNGRPGVEVSRQALPAWLAAVVRSHPGSLEMEGVKVLPDGTAVFVGGPEDPDADDEATL